MKTIRRINLVVPMLLALTGLTFAAPPVTNSDIIVPVDPAVDHNGNPIVDPVVYNSFCNPINPIVAPDGHQVKYSEWVQATGTASMKCEGNGTQVKVDVSGLFPNGVYTAWVLVFGPGPALPDGSNLLGAGALGRPDGTQNIIRASKRGEGHLSVVMPASTLSLIPYPVGPCLLNLPDVGEVQIHIGYHLDGHSHGGNFGDDCHFAVPLGFRFLY